MARFHPSQRPDGVKVVRPEGGPGQQAPEEPAVAQPPEPLQEEPAVAQPPEPVQEEPAVAQPPAEPPVPRRKRAAAKSLVPSKKEREDRTNQEIARNLAFERQNNVITIEDNDEEENEVISID